MAVTDLTGTTWVFNSSITSRAQIPTLTFTSNEQSFTSMELSSTACTYSSKQATVRAYENGVWADEAWRTIEITGGTSATDATFIAWLQENATQSLPTPDISIEYKNAEIASMSASGTKVINTAGTYCEDDITITYVQPSAPTPTLQTKSVTPTESAQTVTPDSGYDGLSQVNVGAISSTYVGSGVTRQAAATITPTTSNQTAVAANRYTTGAVTVSGDANLVAANIKQGVSIFGVEGSFAGGTDTSDATATAADIVGNQTAYARGVKLIGTLPSANGVSF